MRDINIFNTDMFPYLEGEEIKGQALTLTISEIRSEELKSHAGKKEIKEVLYFQETRKGFVLNKTNAKRIAQMYGSMTGQWGGKQITLTTEPVQAFGELHNALRVVPGAIGSNGNSTMSLEKLLKSLNKVERIRHFYQDPNDILTCRTASSPLPEPDDTDGWRVLFVEARDYALAEIDRQVEEGGISPNEVPMAQEIAIRAADDIEDQYPEIFGDKLTEDAQDITPDASGLDLPDTDGIANSS